MPRSLCVLVNHPPYGTLEAAEAIRHARGAVGKGWEVVLAFLGESVQTLLPGQAPPSGEWVCLAEAMSDLMDEAKDRALILAEVQALAALGLSVADLIPRVRVVPLDDVARVLARCDRTLVF
jgi:sulfur relay (sulfurtransferase) complex TusBCD TusD component (DsrE family)